MNPHYFSKQQETPLHEKKVRVTLRGHLLHFTTGSGVFSKTKIDDGSFLLIEKSDIPETVTNILDLGCGYGPVGIAMAKVFPKAKIVMSDINERAIFLTQKNIRQNKIQNATAIQSDGFENIKETFDVILLNPPQTAGKEICFKLIRESKDHLNKNGTLQLVARHQKGGKSLSEYMKVVFGNVKEIAKNKGYRIYVSMNK
ncbi:class I SAM-dependent methyltransferase [Candidatus Woesearchaeota archaeon]|nr:class I SAM-dependent methyltransferase [Candidatus Woesearchaeota archaeon]